MTSAEAVPAAVADALPHGYTADEVWQLARQAVRREAFRSLDRDEAVGTAFHAIVEQLYAASERPAPGRLVWWGRYEVYRLQRAHLRQHGIPEKGETGRGRRPGFARCWLDNDRTLSHESVVVERHAVAQVLPRLTDRQRQVLVALAEHGDDSSAAAALGMTTSAFGTRLMYARRRFRALWHEGEQPYTPTPPAALSTPTALHASGALIVPRAGGNRKVDSRASAGDELFVGAVVGGVAWRVDAPRSR